MVHQVSTITPFHPTSSPQTPLPPFTFANMMSTTTTNSSDGSSETYHHHHWHGRPGTKPKWLGFGSSALNPFPPLTFADCHPFK